MGQCQKRCASLWAPVCHTAVGQASKAITYILCLINKAEDVPGRNTDQSVSFYSAQSK